MGKKQKKVDLSRRDFVKKGAAVGVGATALAALGATEAQAVQRNWDRAADIVVIGGGASGMSAAIRARDLGASVIVVEENIGAGGHAMISGGQVRLGGGTRIQQKQGIDDSPDLIYLENTRPEHPYTRFNDREVVRAFADYNIEVFNWLEANGVKFDDTVPLSIGGSGIITPRLQTAIKPSNDLNITINDSNGSGVMLPLIASATTKGVQLLVQHRMTSIVRENPTSGRVLGITVTNLKENKTLSIQARKAVIACTGGSSSNLVIRRIYDPRLTEEHQVGCEPWSRQSGDAEQQGMAIGASLGCTAQQTNQSGINIQKTAWLGCQYGYAFWDPRSPIFLKAKASGFSINNYQNGILVNMLGQRFYNEVPQDPSFDTGGAPTATFDYFAAAFGSVIVGPDGAKQRLGGPIWFIFDEDGRARLNFTPTPPTVDLDGYFFSASTLVDLAAKIKNPYQKFPMAGANLQQAVARYNGFVDSGKDTDFGKPMRNTQGANIAFKLQKPPFYAAWATPICHDTLSGLRINGKWQVIDVFGKVIPSFYCAGESAAGIALHGLGRSIAGGYIAASNGVMEPSA